MQRTKTVLTATLAALAFAGTASAAHYSAEVLADNPIAYYRLGEASGTTANDASPNNNDGTYVGTVTQGSTGALSPADPNTAVDFNGTGRVDSVALFDPAATDFTVEFWINNSAATAGDTIVSQADGTGTGRSWAYGFASGGGYGISSFLAGVDTFSGFGVLSFGTWYHIALVVTDQGATSDLQWYLNGVAVGGGTGVGIESADGIVKIAAAKDNSGVVDGVLDEVAIYTSALTAERIEEHYNSRFEPIPEPATLALALVGVAILGGRRRARVG